MQIRSTYCPPVTRLAAFIVVAVGTLLLHTVLPSTASAANVVWDFEGGTARDSTDRIGFTDSADGGLTWTQGGVALSNPIQYALIPQNGEHDLVSPDNRWFLRSDWNTQDGGETQAKHNDGETGVLRSDNFLIDDTSGFSFQLGGGTDAARFVLRNAADDLEIIAAAPTENGFIYDSTDDRNPEPQEWTSADLEGAGVTGSQEVYLTIEDNSTGGWGNVAMDDIVATNVTLIDVPPAITAFSADPASLAAAGPVTLSWEADEAGGTLSIDNGGGNVTGLTSTSVAVAATTTFTLTATNGQGEDTAEVTVIVNEPPTISAFTATPNPHNAGSPLSLAWEVIGADTIMIDNGVGAVTPAVGQVFANPLADVTYTLSATNAFGTVTAQQMVTVISPDLVWDFEGRVVVEGDPLQDRLYDQSGSLRFHLVSPGDALPGSGNTFDRIAEGIPSNPVRYDAIADEEPITDTLAADPTNEWLVRADWSFDGDVTHNKDGDEETGEFISDPFTIDATSSFTFDIGGGSDPDGFYLHRASDDSVIISESRGNGFLEEADWTTSELTGAGVAEATQVYLRIADETTGGWGNVSVDNIQAFNVSFSSPDSGIAITDITFDQTNEQFTLTWTSQAGVTYGVFFSTTLEGFGADVTDSVTGQAGTTTFGPFSNPLAPAALPQKLFFRVEEIGG